MKTLGKTVVAVVIGFILVTSIGCATAPKPTAFLGEYAKDLQPGPKEGAKERWLKPGVNFAKYKNVMLESVVFFFAEDAEYKGIDPVEMKELSDGFNLAFVNALKGKYPIVTEPGPDVVRVRFAITELKPSKPGAGVVTTVTMITPIGLGVNLAKKGATGTWTGEGATAGELMAFDSMTNTVIAVARDQRTAGFTGRYTKWGSAEEAFKFWGDRLRTFMDQAHGVKE
jgi:hypothetical protein